MLNSLNLLLNLLILKVMIRKRRKITPEENDQTPRIFGKLLAEKNLWPQKKSVKLPLQISKA